MPHQLYALAIAFESLFIFLIPTTTSCCSEFGMFSCRRLTTHMKRFTCHGGGESGKKRSERSFRIKATRVRSSFSLPKVSYLVLWHRNKLTHEKIKRKSIRFDFSFSTSIDEGWRVILKLSKCVKANDEEKWCKSFQSIQRAFSLSLEVDTLHRRSELQHHTTHTIRMSLISLNPETIQP